LAAAAAACGIKKSPILRAIKSGKVSATKDEHNEWHIEPVECHRLYPPDHVLRERDERIEQWHRSATRDPNVMLLGDPPFERSALAQSSARSGPELLMRYPHLQHKGSPADRRVK
jgi:hypothetical protein